MRTSNLLSELELISDLARRNYAAETITRPLNFIKDIQNGKHLLDIGLKREFWYPNMRVCGIDSKPWYSLEDFPGGRNLKRSTPQILSELIEFSKELPSLSISSFKDLVEQGVWTTVFLKSGSGWEDGVMRRIPRTLQALQKFSHLGELCFLSNLAPRTRVVPHCGPWNLRVNFHLGIKVPIDSGLRVADVCATWTFGDWLVFDDSFEHEVWNHSDTERLVLVMNAWHPSLSQVEISIFSQVSEAIIHFEDIEGQS
jgi:Aspartyl/Asparaginyl beta-hydroxylase